jgi:hypothetical protein
MISSGESATPPLESRSTASPIGHSKNGILSLSSIQSPHRPHDRSESRNRVRMEFDEDEDNSTLAGKKALTIEDKLMTLVSGLEDRLKVIIFF